ncbi:MAG: hypothetical protein LUC98_07260, partial [Lachnospiraceae bacterium]|nr:hypothetical protein [Lachnospiraceae bacterium]
KMKFEYNDDTMLDNTELKINREKRAVLVGKVDKCAKTIGKGLISRTTFLEKIIGIPESSFRTFLNYKNRSSIEEANLIKIYQIYSLYPQSTIDQFCEIFKDGDIVKLILESHQEDFLTLYEVAERINAIRDKESQVYLGTGEEQNEEDEEYRQFERITEFMEAKFVRELSGDMSEPDYFINSIWSEKIQRLSEGMDYYEDNETKWETWHVVQKDESGTTIDESGQLLCTMHVVYVMKSHSVEALENVRRLVNEDLEADEAGEHVILVLQRNRQAIEGMNIRQSLEELSEINRKNVVLVSMEECKAEIISNPSEMQFKELFNSIIQVV